MRERERACVVDPSIAELNWIITARTLSYYKIVLSMQLHEQKQTNFSGAAFHEVNKANPNAKGSNGAMEQWGNGAMEQWSNGAMGQWSNCVSEKWMQQFLSSQRVLKMYYNSIQGFWGQGGSFTPLKDVCFPLKISKGAWTKTNLASLCKLKRKKFNFMFGKTWSIIFTTTHPIGKNILMNPEESSIQKVQEDARTITALSHSTLYNLKGMRRIRGGGEM